MRRIQGPAGSLNVDDGGRERETPVILVHSFGGDASHWSRQLDHLRRDRRAIAIDLRGHGGSDAPATGDYAVTSLAEDLGAVADALGIETVVLVGHSLGGAAAIAYAGAHPDRVAGLVLIGTPGRTPPEQVRQVMASLESDRYQEVMDAYWEKLLDGATPETRSLVDRGRRAIAREPALAMIRATFEFDPGPSLEAYPGPTLLIVTPADDTPSSLRRLLPDAPIEVIEGTSHWSHMDRPDRVNGALDRFLERVDARPQEAGRR